jgi:hypothetical protein
MALISKLVPRSHLTNAVSLNSSVSQAAHFIGPMIAGVSLEWLARIIHGFLRSCEKLASIVKRLQFEYPMLKFMQDVASLVMVRPKKPIFRKHPYVSLL